MNDYMTLLHKHKINGGFLAPDRIPMEERNKNEMILELQNEVHTKDKEIERLETNWKVAVEDLSKIAELLDLEEGCTIYDIEDKIKKLNNIINEMEESLKDDKEEYSKDLDIETKELYNEYWRGYSICANKNLEYLQELKRSDK